MAVEYSFGIGENLVTLGVRYNGLKFQGWWRVQMRQESEMANTALRLVIGAFGTSFPNHSVHGAGIRIPAKKKRPTKARC